jgi:hypothetical protein
VCRGVEKGGSPEHRRLTLRLGDASARREVDSSDDDDRCRKGGAMKWVGKLGFNFFGVDVACDADLNTSSARLAAAAHKRWP